MIFDMGWGTALSCKEQVLCHQLHQDICMRRLLNEKNVLGSTAVFTHEKIVSWQKRVVDAIEIEIIRPVQKQKMNEWRQVREVCQLCRCIFGVNTFQTAKMLCKPCDRAHIYAVSVALWWCWPRVLRRSQLQRKLTLLSQASARYARLCGNLIEKADLVWASA